MGPSQEVSFTAQESQPDNAARVTLQKPEAGTSQPSAATPGARRGFGELLEIPDGCTTVVSRNAPARCPGRAAASCRLSVAAVPRPGLRQEGGRLPIAKPSLWLLRERQRQRKRQKNAHWTDLPAALCTPLKQPHGLPALKASVSGTVTLRDAWFWAWACPPSYTGAVSVAAQVPRGGRGGRWSLRVVAVSLHVSKLHLKHLQAVPGADRKSHTWGGPCQLSVPIEPPLL